MIRRTFLSVAALLLIQSGFGAEPGLHWYKGNTHTHTNNSDGDTSPELVARWYRDNKYDFLVLTDHNKQTPVDALPAELSKGKKPFLLIPGEEISDGSSDPQRKGPIHMNAISASRVVGKQGGASVGEVLQHDADAAHAAGALVHVNHPNFQWMLTAEDLFGLKGVKHFEVYNGHPTVHNAGGGGSQSTEEIWDTLLSRGRLYYGVATDDAHNYKAFDRGHANPGRGWIVVRAAQLAPQAVLDAMDRGDFYASTGVELDDISTSGKALRLKIHPKSNGRYRTQFIGKNGALLKEDTSLEPSYELKSGDSYVRARVTSSSDDHAWTQPLFVKEP